MQSPLGLTRLSVIAVQPILAMKHSILFTALGLVALGAAAQEVGTVISSTPIVQQVAVPRQVCNNAVYPAQPTTGAGGVIGALTGAGIGNAIGHGMGHS